MDYLFKIEEGFEKEKAVSFMQNNWHYSLYFSAFYVASVFSLKRYMHDRERYNLRLPLFMWSLSLSLFSMVGFYVSGVRHVSHLYHSGWESSVCDDVFTRGRPGLWAFLFCFSKLPELADTYFIIARKQRLIFLHWYHHITVFVYCWYNYGYQTNPAQWFITLNYFVHSVMYLYYAVRASGRFRPPIWVNMVITVLQTLQMVVGVYISLYIYVRMDQDSNWKCDKTTYLFLYWSFAMYLSYFVLFAHFFWSTYFSKSPKSDKKPQAEGEKHIGSTTEVATHALCNGLSSNGSITYRANGVGPMYQNGVIGARH